MSYTLTCPDPDCNTTFELEDKDFDKIYEADDMDITCPACGQEFPWDYDPAKPDGEEITLELCEDDEEDDEEGLPLAEAEEEEDEEEEN
jgi:hypothetical protein